MFCKNCGNEIPDGSINCSLCGATQQNSEVSASSVQVPVQTHVPTPNGPKKNKTILIAIIAALIVIVLVVVGIFVIKPAIENNNSGSSQSENEDKNVDSTDKENKNDEQNKLSDTKRAEATVKLFFDNIMSLDDDGILEFVDSANIPADETDLAIKLFTSVFDNFDYEIISSEQVNSKTVNVTIATKTIDANEVMEIYIDKMYDYAMNAYLSDNPPSDEESNAKAIELLVEAFANPGVGTTSGEAVIEVVLVDGEWTITDTEGIFNIMAGDMDAAMENADL